MANEKDENNKYEGGQFLTFRLEHEIFGVPIDTVREVLDYVPVTRVPGAVEFLKGVVNLRGAVVPVADIRIKFNMAPTVQTEKTCIIVVEVDTSADDGKISVGVLADQVMAVAEIGSADMQMPPDMGTGIPSRYLRGLGKLDDTFFMILDVEGVVKEEAADFATALPSRETGNDRGKAALIN